MKQKIVAPKYLKAKTREWFESVIKDYELEPHHIRLLTMAAESWDEAQAAREVVAKEGLTYIDRFDCPKARPEVAIERDCRTSFARLLRELCLDIDPPKETGRPPNLY